MVKVKVKKLREDAIVPSYNSQSAAGADLYACTDGETIMIDSDQTVVVHTGLALEIPEGYVGYIYARSGLATKNGLAPANKVGVIDSDYRGEIMIALHNHSGTPQEIRDNERVAQLVIAPVLTAQFEETAELSDTLRGSGGFGSTGK